MKLKIFFRDLPVEEQENFVRDLVKCLPVSRLVAFDYLTNCEDEPVLIKEITGLRMSKGTTRRLFDWMLVNMSNFL